MPKHYLTHVRRCDVNLTTVLRKIRASGVHNGTLFIASDSKTIIDEVAAGGAPNGAIPSPAGRVQQGWIAPQPNPLNIQSLSGYTTGGNYGCTVWKLNKNPVVETVYDDGDLINCSSAADHTSNFRSWHEGGGQFLLGDGSGRFISENIDQSVYNALGTRGNDEVVGEF